MGRRTWLEVYSLASFEDAFSVLSIHWINATSSRVPQSKMNLIHMKLKASTSCAYFSIIQKQKQCATIGTPAISGLHHYAIQHAILVLQRMAPKQHSPPRSSQHAISLPFKDVRLASRAAAELTGGLTNLKCFFWLKFRIRNMPAAVC